MVVARMVWRGKTSWLAQVGVPRDTVKAIVADRPEADFLLTKVHPVEPPFAGSDMLSEVRVAE